jgi:hypothetical protein
MVQTSWANAWLLILLPVPNILKDGKRPEAEANTSTFGEIDQEFSFPCRMIMKRRWLFKRGKIDRDLSRMSNATRAAVNPVGSAAAKDVDADANLAALPPALWNQVVTDTWY